MQHVWRTNVAFIAPLSLLLAAPTPSRAAAAAESSFVLVDLPTRQQYPLFAFLPWPASIPQQVLGLLVALLLVLAFPRIRPLLQEQFTETAQSLAQLYSDCRNMLLDSKLPFSANGFSSAKFLPNGSGTNLRRRRRDATNMPSSTTPGPSSGQYYPGLVNTGNTCFFNSVIQSLASVPAFVQHVEYMRQVAEQVDIPTPVVDALVDLITALNRPTARHSAIRPQELSSALALATQSSSMRSLLEAHRQQDAHELLLLLLDALSLERKAILAGIDEQEHASRRHGLAGLLGQQQASSSSSSSTPLKSDPFHRARQSLKSPFDALVAQRTACLHCGYYGSIPHSTQEELGLNLPSRGSRAGVPLSACLDDWGSLEPVQWRCWRCTLRWNLAIAQEQVTQLESVRDGAQGEYAQSSSTAKKKKKKKKKKSKAGDTQSQAMANGNGNGQQHQAEDGEEEEETNVDHSHDPSPSPSLSPAPPPQHPSRNNLTPSGKKRLAKAHELLTSIETAMALHQSEETFRHIHPDIHLEHPPQPAASHIPTGSKQMLFARPPPILSIHLNRSLYYGSGAGKNNTPVHYEEFLDLRPWCTSEMGVEQDPRRAMNALQEEEEEVDEDWEKVGSGGIPPPRTGAHSHREPSYLSPSFTRHPPQPIPYRLQGVVVHYGGHSFGHYVSYRRAPSPNSSQWLRISDDSVQRTTLNEALSQNASILLYEKVQLTAETKSVNGSGNGDSTQTTSTPYGQSKARCIMAWQVGAGGRREGREPVVQTNGSSSDSTTEADVNAGVGSNT